MAKYKASGMQTLFDLAIQLTGSADNVFDIIDSTTELESLNSDPTQKTVNYTLNGNFAQKHFIANEINVATKPINPVNSNEGALLKDDGGYLLMDDGFKFLM